MNQKRHHIVINKIYEQLITERPFKNSSLSTSTWQMALDVMIIQFRNIFIFYNQTVE